MDAHHGAVDHRDVAVVDSYDGVHEPVPDARLAPAVEAIVAGRIGTVALRQVAPRRAGPQDPADAVQHSPVINPQPSAPLVRQQGLNHRPLESRQIVASTHDQASTVWQLEPNSLRSENPNLWVRDLAA